MKVCLKKRLLIQVDTSSGFSLWKEQISIIRLWYLNFQMHKYVDQWLTDSSTPTALYNLKFILIK